MEKLPSFVKNKIMLYCSHPIRDIYVQEFEWFLDSDLIPTEPDDFESFYSLLNLRTSCSFVGYKYSLDSGFSPSVVLDDHAYGLEENKKSNPSFHYHPESVKKPIIENIAYNIWMYNQSTDKLCLLTANTN